MRAHRYAILCLPWKSPHVEWGCLAKYHCLSPQLFREKLCRLNLTFLISPLNKNLFQPFIFSLHGHTPHHQQETLPSSIHSSQLTFYPVPGLNLIVRGTSLVKCSPFYTLSLMPSHLSSKFSSGFGIAGSLFSF